MQQPATLAIGALAGIAGGLMALAGFHAGAFAVLLMFAAPVAIYIAALGWGTVAGFLAAFIATAVTFYDGSLVSVVATGTLLFLPAAWCGHLANLARPADNGQGLVWYPLSGILTWLMLALAAGFVATGAVAGFNAAEIGGVLADTMRELAGNEPGAEELAAIDRTALLYAGLLPLIMPALWLLMHVLVFHGAAAITRQSKRLARPGDDIPATATLPAWTLALPVGGIAGMSLLASPLYEIAAVVAGVGIAGIGLIGLAELHLASRGRPGRGVLLFVTYLLLVLFSLPLLFFAIWGATRILRRHNAAAGGPPALRG